MNIKVSSSLLLAKEIRGNYGVKLFSVVTEVLWRAPCLIRIKRCGSMSRIVPLVSPDRCCCSIKTIKARLYSGTLKHIFSHQNIIYN
jgi:hypothetical protein